MFDDKVVECVKNVTKTNIGLLTEHGKFTLTKIRVLRDLFLKKDEDKKKRLVYTDKFLNEFIEFYEKNEKFQGSLLCQIVELVMARCKNYKSQIPPKVMDFFCLISNFNQASAEILAAQFDGPTIRSIARHRKKYKLRTEKSYC